MASANHSGMSAPRQGNTVSRRALLAAIPAIAVLPAVAAVPAVAAETPVRALFREWTRRNEIVNAACADKTLTEEAFLALLERRTEVEDQILLTPARDAQDFLLKVFARTTAGETPLPGDVACPVLWTEARAMVGA